MIFAKLRTAWDAFVVNLLLGVRDKRSQFTLRIHSKIVSNTTKLSAVTYCLVGESYLTLIVLFYSKSQEQPLEITRKHQKTSKIFQNSNGRLHWDPLLPSEKCFFTI